MKKEQRARSLRLCLCPAPWHCPWRPAPAATLGTSNSSGSGNTSGSGNGDGYKIAVVRQLDHASMNEIRDAITAELDAKEKKLGVEIEYKDFNGNNDTSTLAQIGAEIIAGGYDAIVPIGHAGSSADGLYRPADPDPGDLRHGQLPRGSQTHWHPLCHRHQ